MHGITWLEREHIDKEVEPDNVVFHVVDRRSIKPMSQRVWCVDTVECFFPHFSGIWILGSK